MLSVWLPLNGNLDNQGLANVTVSNNGAMVNTAGKIGSCYSFSGNSLYGDWSEINTLTQISGCCWVYLNNLSSAQYFFHLGGQSSYPCKFSLDYEGSIRFQINGTEYISGITLITGIWYHLAITWNGTMAKLYVNGIESYSKSAAGSFSASNHFAIGARTNGTAGNTFAYAITNGGKLNDIRFYDHCLSPREVKQVSTALVLHYPLSMPGQENLIEKSSDFTGWSINSIFTIDQISTGEYVASASRTGATSNMWSRIIPTVKLNPELYPNGVTVSFDFKCNDISALDHKCICALQIYNASNTRIGWYEAKNSFSEANYVGGTTLQNNKWKRLSCYFTQSNLKTVSSSGYTVNDISYTMLSFQLVKNGSISFKNIKLECGSHPTSWIPNSADAEYSTLGFNDGIEYDVSGYGNNGTKVGTITYDSDTPRYNTSTKFTDNSYIKHKLPEQMYYATYSFWVKASSYTNYGAIYITFGSPGSGYSPWLSVNTESCKVWAHFGNNSPNYTKGASGSVTTNEWHHCVYVWDNGVAQWYLDGEKCGNAVTYTGRTYIENSGEATIGDSYTGSSWGGTPFAGQLSDFRVYATALSAADILELYHTPITLSNNGTLLTQGEYVES